VIELFRFLTSIVRRSKTVSAVCKSLHIATAGAMLLCILLCQIDFSSSYHRNAKGFRDGAMLQRGNRLALCKTLSSPCSRSRNSSNNRTRAQLNLFSSPIDRPLRPRRKPMDRQSHKANAHNNKVMNQTNQRRNRPHQTNMSPRIPAPMCSRIDDDSSKDQTRDESLAHAAIGQEAWEFRVGVQGIHVG
jgi:hypothetical protein